MLKRLLLASWIFLPSTFSQQEPVRPVVEALPPYEHHHIIYRNIYLRPYVPYGPWGLRSSWGSRYPY
jgi:hypothetical protein